MSLNLVCTHHALLPLSSLAVSYTVSPSTLRQHCPLLHTSFYNTSTHSPSLSHFRSVLLSYLPRSIAPHLACADLLLLRCALASLASSLTSESAARLWNGPLLQQDAMGGTKESSPAGAGADGEWEPCGEARADRADRAAQMELGEDMMHHLLGQGIEGASFMAIDTCAASSATSLDDVRNAQGQVGLSSEEQCAADWSAQV